MKTTVIKNNPTSNSSKPFFTKNGEGSFFSQRKETEKPFFSSYPIQTKLTIGETSENGAGKIKNQNGIPNLLKAGIEQLSGMDLSGVQVHKNSSKPAQLNALAYAQGQDIYLSPGQDKHLPHEGWHVVQQMQGRVKPMIQTKGVSVNDDRDLEREADVMGAKATQMTPSKLVMGQSSQQRSMLTGQPHIVSQMNSSGAIVQRAPSSAQETQWQTDWNDPSLQRHHRSFNSKGRPTGTPEQRYYDLCPLYFAHGIQRPLIYIRDNIVTARFFQFSTPAHRDLATALTNAETSLKGKGYSDPLPFLSKGFSFNPRTTSEGNWSNHADGKAIDFDSSLNPRLNNKKQRNVISVLTGFDMDKPNPGLVAGMDSYDASKAASESFKKNYNPEGIRARLETLTGQQDFIATRIMTTQGHLSSIPKKREATSEDKRLRVELISSLKKRKKEARIVTAQIKLMQKELKKIKTLDDVIFKLKNEILMSHLSIIFLDTDISIATGSKKNKLIRKKKAKQRALKTFKKQLNKKEKQRDSNKLRQYSHTGFLNLPKDMVTELTNAGLEWGGDWGSPSSKDFMHFEVP